MRAALHFIAHSLLSLVRRFSLEEEKITLPQKRDREFRRPVRVRIPLHRAILNPKPRKIAPHELLVKDPRTGRCRDLADASRHTSGWSVIFLQSRL